MPTFLLIHGAWHASWCWKKIVPSLKKAGATILTPDLPGRGNCKIPHSHISLQTYIDFLKKTLEEVSGPVILVGHSFSGIIASQLASVIPDRISHIVYLAGFLPQNGDSLMSIARSINHTSQPAAMRVDSYGNTISIDPDKAPELFFNCCTLEEKLRGADLLCPEPFHPMTEEVSLDASFKKIPKTYIECTKDNALTLDAQRIMCSRIPCKVLSLATDHSPFLSEPTKISEILLSLIR